MKKDNKLYIVYDYEKPKFVDSAIGINKLSEVLNKSLSATKQSLRRYKKSKSFIYLNGKKVIIVSEDDLK